VQVERGSQNVNLLLQDRYMAEGSQIQPDSHASSNILCFSPYTEVGKLVPGRLYNDESDDTQHLRSPAVETVSR